MATILDGKALAAHLRAQIKEDTVALPRRPGLAVILVGEDPASQLYVRNKTKDCEECGYLSRRFDLPADTSEEILLGIINKLNRDSKIDGILVQRPLPPQINEKSIIEAIAPEKDVDERMLMPFTPSMWAEWSAEMRLSGRVPLRVFRRCWTLTVFPRTEKSV